LALEKKAEDIVIMDMKKSSLLCDYFVIASAESTRRVKTIADNVVCGLIKAGVKVHHIEGAADALWLLLDYGDVVCHIFHGPLRKFYDLERLWQDVPKERICSRWENLISKKTYPA